MKAYGFQIGAFESLGSGLHYDDRDFTFGLQVLQAVGAQCGLELCGLKDGENIHNTDALMVSILSTDMYWDVPKWLRKRQIVIPSGARGEDYPLVIGGGQAFYNPEPVAEVFDLIFVGDADENLPLFVDLFHKRRAVLSREQFLKECRDIPGIYVPGIDHGRQVAAQNSRDIATSLRVPLLRLPRRVRRVEIARGCKHKCPFCVLGWRADYRENSASEVLKALSVPHGSRYVHLQAGDAESHSEIAALRSRLEDLGLRDKSWTGRLDTVDSNSTLEGGKYYAFGLEAPSLRMRRAYGKPYSNEFVVNTLRDLYDRGATGLGMHVMLGLPGEGEADLDEWRALLCEIAALRCVESHHLTLHWHWAYFQPAAHTPMQWAAPGLTRRMYEIAYEEWGIDNHAAIFQKIGRRLRSLSRHMCACISGRGDRASWWLIQDLDKRLARMHLTAPETPDVIRGVVAAHGYAPEYFFGALERETALPFDFIQARYSQDELWRAYVTMLKRLDEPES